MRTRRGTYASPTEEVCSIFPQAPFSISYALLQQASSVDELSQVQIAQQTEFQSNETSHLTSSRQSIRGCSERATGPGQGTRRMSRIGSSSTQHAAHAPKVYIKCSLLQTLIPLSYIDRFGYRNKGNAAESYITG